MSDKLSGCFKQVVLAQAGLSIVCALVAGLTYGSDYALAAVFGAVLALINTILSRRSIQRASELAYSQPDVGMLPVFSGLLQRIVVFAAGFAGGVLLGGLLPLPMLAGFALAQLGYLACRIS